MGPLPYADLRHDGRRHAAPDREPNGGWHERSFVETLTGLKVVRPHLRNRAGYRTRGFGINTDSPSRGPASPTGGAPAPVSSHHGARREAGPPLPEVRAAVVTTRPNRRALEPPPPNAGRSSALAELSAPGRRPCWPTARRGTSISDPRRSTDRRRSSRGTPRPRSDRRIHSG